MELGNRLSVDAYNDYANRLYEFGVSVMDAGYTLSDKIFGMSDWQTLLVHYLIKDIDKKYPPHLLKDDIFNAQEKILETLDDTVDWINPYLQIDFRFSKKNGVLYSYVKRWFDWLEYNEKIVSGEIQKHQYLFSTEDGAEEQILDINGEPIMTLEGYFGETTTN